MDVKDIMGVSRAPGAPAEKADKPKERKMVKPKGMSRWGPSPQPARAVQGRLSRAERLNRPGLMHEACSHVPWLVPPSLQRSICLAQREPPADAVPAGR